MYLLPVSLLGYVTIHLALNVLITLFKAEIALSVSFLVLLIEVLRGCKVNNTTGVFRLILYLLTTSFTAVKLLFLLSLSQ